jgi:hypothetical protein
VMGLSLADCKRLGIPLELHPAVSGRSEGDVLRERFGIGEEAPASQSPDDGMNKTERAFAEVLKAACRRMAIAQWAREPITFRLAGRTRYTPDFAVWPVIHEADDFRFTLIEVKGFMRDDASVKLKVAADTYYRFRWLLVRHEGRHGWDVREVNSRGIGTSPIRVPWIHGG